MPEQKIVCACDTLRTSRIELIDPKNPSAPVVQLSPIPGGGGLWVGAHPNLVGIWSQNGHPAIGIYDQDCSRGCALAFSLNDGVPSIQFRDRAGVTRIVSIEDALALAPAEAI